MASVADKLDSKFFIAFAMSHDTLKAGLKRSSSLNVTQYRVLMMVYQARPDVTPQASVRQVLHLKANLASNAIATLEKLRYIAGTSNSSDARARDLSITGTGKRHIDKVNAALVEELYRRWPTEDPAFRRILEATILTGGRVESAIPQTNPDYFPASHVLTLIERSTQLIEEDVFATTGMSLVECRILQRMLEVGAPLRMRDVASQLLLAPASTSRAMAPLIEAGLVQRLASPTDAKAVYVALTDEGEVSARRAVHAMNRAGAKHFWGPMDGESRKAFRAMGDIVIADLQKRREVQRLNALERLVPMD